MLPSATYVLGLLAPWEGPGGRIKPVSSAGRVHHILNMDVFAAQNPLCSNLFLFVDLFFTDDLE